MIHVNAMGDLSSINILNNPISLTNNFNTRIFSCNKFNTSTNKRSFCFN